MHGQSAAPVWVSEYASAGNEMKHRRAPRVRILRRPVKRNTSLERRHVAISVSSQALTAAVRKPRRNAKKV